MIQFSTSDYSAAIGLPLWITSGAAGVLGVVIGSFLNVVIHRVPAGESIIFPTSRCPACGTNIRPYDNIPVLSYMILGGKCRACKSGISIRYPLVELATGLLFAATAYFRGVGLNTPFDLALTATLVALVFIDAEHMILPNAITYPGICVALIARILIPLAGNYSSIDDLPSVMHGLVPTWPIWAASLLGAGLGALAGGGSLWLMGWLWERLRGVEAMGLGDVKMMFMVGAYLGWRLAILTIFVGVFTGSIAGIGLMIKDREKNLQRLLPFGIFLGIGSLVSLLMGTQIVSWYSSQIFPH